MKAIILAGGKGTRLKPITDELPKALIPINGKNLTECVIDIFRNVGVNEILLSVAYKKEQIKEYFGNGKKHGVQVSYIDEKEPLGTAGPLIILNSKRQQIDETFFMANGDNLIDADLNQVLEFHKKHREKNNCMATIVLIKVSNPSHYGVAVLEENNSDSSGERIKQFVEKPKNPPSEYTSSGYYILEPEVFDIIAGKNKAMMEKDVFPELAKQGKLCGFKHEGLWFDTGTHERYEEVKKKWNF